MAATTLSVGTERRKLEESGTVEVEEVDLANEPSIEVTRHGPYEVTGNVPVVPKTPVRSERGEPLTWKSEAPLDHDQSYDLCRCGQSANKPFCDGSHAFVGFDGTENAPTEPSSDRARRHVRTGITIVHDKQLCVHSGFCANQVTDWYKMSKEAEDPIVRGHLMGMVEHCPSGALAYEVDDVTIEPSLPQQISPIPNGPLWVTGGITITRADGKTFETRNRVVLCRCGASSTKPLCDGTHLEIGFET